MNHPPLMSHMRLIPCALTEDGWLCIPHADDKWVTAVNLVPFSLEVIKYWEREQAEQAAQPQPTEEQLDSARERMIEWISAAQPQAAPAPATQAEFLADKSPGSEWHLTLMMAPHGLNLVVGSDRQHLLAYARDVWETAQDVNSALIAASEPEQAEPTAQLLPGFIRREVERAIDEAVNPKGMSVHDGKARIGADKLSYLLMVIDAAANGRSQPAATQADVPEGFVLVPKEPTRAMCKAAAGYGLPANTWRAMLAAAPQPTQGEKDV